MSHKWVAGSVDRLSEAALHDVKQEMQKYVHLLTYDNIQMSFRVFSQRLDNQGSFGNGTAATVYIKRGAEPLSSQANQLFQEYRAKGLENPLTPLEIMDASIRVEPRLRLQMAYHIRRLLFQSPQFDFSTYHGRDSASLQAPVADSSRQLPHGPDHTTSQYLLGSVDIPEAAYEDHTRLLEEWLKQLGLGSCESHKDIGVNRVIPIVGDQLTVDRMRGLITFRAEDMNSYDRLNWLLAICGWLHTMMTFGKSMHKQYFGTSKGRGLKQAFELLQRKGLHTTATKGPFHHHLVEALYHIGEAHIHAEWLSIAGVMNLAELRDKGPEELLHLSDLLLEKCASTEALRTMDNIPQNQQDAERRQVIMFNRDVLHFILLNEAIKHGDIGTMEDMLPTLLFRFVGGQSSNYATEILELMQGLYREWPPEIADFVRQNCWLVNFSGKPDMFLPIDQAQEFNIKDIKVGNLLLCIYHWHPYST